MNALRTLAIRVNAVLILVAAGLLLGLALAWRIHDTRGTVAYEEQEYAAELLAHGLPQQAVAVLEKTVQSAPLAARSMRLRQAMAEILMDRLGDYERALAELVFIRAFETSPDSDLEPMIQQCLHRLGRVYDLQRRMLLADGKNPLVSAIASDTVIKLGQESACTVAEVRQRLAQAGISPSEATKEQLDALLQSIAGEILLRRAAKRAGIARQADFLLQVRQFEDNLALQKYLESEVLQGVEVDSATLDMFMEQHAHEFDSPLRVVFSELSFAAEEDARAFVRGATPASAPQVLVNQRNSGKDELPAVLRSIDWEKEAVQGALGPIEKNGAWLVYQVHEVVPARRVPPQLARQQMKVRLLEAKKAEKLSAKMQQLAEQEELKIMHTAIATAFPEIASASTPLTGLPAHLPSAPGAPMGQPFSHERESPAQAGSR